MSTDTPLFYKGFIEYGRAMQHAVHNNAKAHGWYDQGEVHPGLSISNIHREVSEAFDALSAGNPESEKIPGYNQAVEELADAALRIMDMCEYHGWNLFEAMVAKHEFNKGRTYRHGGKKF